MKPGSPEWTSKVTASKVAAILGLSPWDSPLTMWMRMHGDLGPDESNPDAKARGHYLESGVIRWWLDQHPEVSEYREQAQYGNDWSAATPDVAGTFDHGDRTEKFVMDAKTAASADDWGDEPPAYYLAQSLWQMHLSGADVAYIAVLFGRPQLAFREYAIERDPALIDSIVIRCREFYDSLSLDEAPPLSGMACEYDAIRKAHPDIDKGETAVLPDDLADEYLAAYFAEKDLPGIKARVLDAMGRAQHATTEDGRKIARRQPSAGAVALYCAAKRPAKENEAA